MCFFWTLLRKFTLRALPKNLFKDFLIVESTIHCKCRFSERKTENNAVTSGHPNPMKSYLSLYLQAENKKIVAKTLLRIYYLPLAKTLYILDCTAAPHSLVWGAGKEFYNEENIGD